MRPQNQISIHAPTRGATVVAIPAVIAKNISIHAPTRGATGTGKGIFYNCRDFNPRSHERSDKSPVGAMFVGNNISIHAPTRGATVRCSCCRLFFRISIHAPTRGATISKAMKKANEEISIHAPTRGATAILHKKFVYFYTIPTINI